jgi:acetyl esterase
VNRDGDEPHVDPAHLAEIVENRARMLRESAALVSEPVARVVDLDADGVPCRLFVPSGDVPFTVVYAHGGGFAFGEVGTHDPTMRAVANATGCAVLFIDYRRSPEHRFPAAVEDVERATAWWREHAVHNGLAGDRLLAIGDSAGANLALGLVLHHPDWFVGQVLIYPFVDARCATYDRGLVEPDLPITDCEFFWSLYAPNEAAYDDVDFDPLLATGYAGLPPTLIQLAELDVLTPTGHLLAQRMQVDGVPARTLVYGGVPHGFWRRSAEYPQSEQAMDDLIAWIGVLR